MSDLDKKLVKIVGDGQPTALAVADIVNDIKQAFIDAGWSAPIEYNKPTENVFGEPVAFDPTKVIDSIPVNVMTGQEWYDRFKAELLDDSVYLDLPDDALYTTDVLRSARKVARIERPCNSSYDAIAGITSTNLARDRSGCDPGKAAGIE